VSWHLIGHLQRNKVRRAIALFDWIHSVDSLRLAQELSTEAERAGTTVRALVQVNASGEATKGGFDAARETDAVAAVAALPGLSCEGLMTMAPLTDDEALLRATFARTRSLLERCAAQGVPLRGRELSMGMSHDYELAIEEGSTMIRLGTVLFGERL
jgi:PLP dependent protein